MYTSFYQNKSKPIWQVDSFLRSMSGLKKYIFSSNLPTVALSDTTLMNSVNGYTDEAIKGGTLGAKVTQTRLY